MEITKQPTTSLYERIGGETVIRQLVDRFYDLMEVEPLAAGIRALHPADLSASREKLFLFLAGWMGGPPLYVQRFGHPRLRARHLPFPIAERERDEWLWCMFKALDEFVPDVGLREQLAHSLAQTADFMRNQEG
ncbi:MAG: group II truncated hemoglobin [Acidobacteria bacterium]|nr:group II truncated hemoglobin [Acidobacteriota bacterium]MBI3428065.1 group II truncated hemoglobin [Acidobacteriota bacterium]